MNKQKINNKALAFSIALSSITVIGVVLGQGAAQKTKLYDIDNPYQNVAWDSTQAILSTNHIHITSQEALDRAYEYGYRHLPISNYYPSAPYYPPGEMRINQFRVKQDFGVTRLPKGEKPHFVEGPLNWNDIIMDPETGWYDSLPEELKKQMPFKLGGPVYQNIPKDVIFAPNAEQHSFTDVSGNIHATSVGSLYSSGTFDARNRFSTFRGGGDYCFGTGLPWREAFKGIIDNLLFEDGGGVVVNHPAWTNRQNKNNLPQSLLQEMLDFDSRVLGFEISNNSEPAERAEDIQLWDDILSTGRKCYAFSSPDWRVQIAESEGKFFNILLVDKFTERQCLKAYRDGVFYASTEYGGDLRFNEITLHENKLKVRVSDSSKISFIANATTVKKIDNSKEAEYTIPLDEQGIPTIKYIRVEAENASKSRVFSQAIRFIKL